MLTTLARPGYRFNPRSIPGLQLWLAADRITGLSDGQAVATWPDASGNGYDATQATAAKQPLYKVGIRNGKPVVRFDGTDDVLYLSNGLGMLQNVSGATAFVVCQSAQPAASSRQCLLGITTNTADTIRFTVHREGTPCNMELWARRLDADAEVSVAGAMFRAGAWEVGVYQANYAAGTGLIRRNGRQLASGNLTSAGSTSDTDSNAITVGGFGTTSSYPLNGDIAEILVYNRALGDGEIRRIEVYLARKWGLPLGPVLSGVPAATTPSVGANIISNSNMETGDPPTGWLIAYGAADGVPDERTGGSGVQSLAVTNTDANLAFIYRGSAIGAGTFCRGSAWLRRVTSDAKATLYDGTWSQAVSLIQTGSITWVQGITWWHCPTATIYTAVQNLSGGVGLEARYDDYEVCPITLSSTLSSVGDAGRRDGEYYTAITLPVGTNIRSYLAGLAVCLNSAANPTYGIFAWTDRYYVWLKKLEAGTWTTLINTPTGVTYADGRQLWIVIQGTTVKVYYESSAGTLSQIGTDQTVANIANYGTLVAALDPSGLCTIGEVKVLL